MAVEDEEAVLMASAYVSQIGLALDFPLRL
jgi:hypothetical protein